MKEVYLTVRSDTTRIPGSVIHYAYVHDMDDSLLVSATLDYVLAAAQERGYVFVGENAKFVAQEEAREQARSDGRLREFLEERLAELRRDWERDAEINDYERSMAS